MHAPAETVERLEDGLLVIMPRDENAERAAFERLGKLALIEIGESLIEGGSEHAKDLSLAPSATSNSYETLARLEDPSRFIAFSAQAVPLLRSEGWQISYSDDYPYRIAEGEVDWWADLGEGSASTGSRSSSPIEFEGRRINLAPQLASMISKLPSKVSQRLLLGDPAGSRELAKSCKRLKFYHTLPDGRLLPIPSERLARISHTKKCIGAPNQRKFFCDKDFPEIRGRPDDDRL